MLGSLAQPPFVNNLFLTPVPRQHAIKPVSESIAQIACSVDSNWRTSSNLYHFVIPTAVSSG